MSVPKDRMNKEITLTCRVLRAIVLGSSPSLELCIVTKVEGDIVWLDNSKTAIIYNERLVVV